MNRFFIRFKISRLPGVSWRCISSESSSSYVHKRNAFAKEIEALPEHKALIRLKEFIESKALQHTPSVAIGPPVPPPQGYKYEMSNTQLITTLDAMLATFCLHVESRIASLLGKGFYTIGPCGEEALSSAALCLQQNDTLALHYRHLGINLCRQIASGVPLSQLLLDRARGYTVSKYDPVTGGVHCSIGSDNPNDLIVTSTLASQCPPAVGRALGFSLRPNGNKERPVSMVTLGDGSVHNHHFWSAFHLARHARHKRIKCPVLFGISDNGLSISYSTEGYVDTLFDNDPLIPVFRANGSDTMDVYSQTRSAIEYARRQSAPAIIIYKNIVRRFGHAASDRQAAYLDDEQIQNMANTDVVGSAIVQAVEISAATNYISVQKRLTEIEGLTLSAFALSSNEEKVTREEMLQQLWAPVVSVNTNHPLIFSSDQDRKEGEKVDVMRKHMNRVIAEAMEDDNRVIYLGEDVAHGGYYVVTEGLAEKFPGRVLDFPPDETSLLGAAMGFAQVGLIPIIEIPYAKYLDCGADMFNEIAISYWLSRGKRPNGMIVRLQGFDRGLFGGNFHTSNQLNLIPPGIHVVCYSNGEDYAMGFRNALDQAKQGSVVVSVDCTNLLNLRHLHDKDRGWERSYPPKQKIIGFDFVRRYGKEGKHAIVTYGNGVVTAIQARKLLSASGEIADHDIDVVDCPLLSSVPKGLRTIVSQYESVIFADVCKEGPGGNILSSLACSLQKEGRLPNKWQLVCAPRTYNPLGSFTTFLNVEDIVETFRGMHKGNHDTRQKAISQS